MRRIQSYDPNSCAHHGVQRCSAGLSRSVQRSSRNRLCLAAHPAYSILIASREQESTHVPHS